MLAAEVAGRDEDEQSLRDKARWYLERGVEIVWLVLPEPREVRVAVERAGSGNGQHPEEPVPFGNRKPPDPHQKADRRRPGAGQGREKSSSRSPSHGPKLRGVAVERDRYVTAAAASPP